jgi:hypothetical protein
VAYSEYDVVKVIALNPDVPEAEIGDTGTILMVFKHENNRAYEVECVLSNATNKWLGTFEPSQLQLV